MRQEILCDSCGANMVFTRKITPSPEGLSVIGLHYRCPNRSGEKGCGQEKEIIVYAKDNTLVYW